MFRKNTFLFMTFALLVIISRAQVDSSDDVESTTEFDYDYDGDNDEQVEVTEEPEKEEETPTEKPEEETTAEVPIEETKTTEAESTEEEKKTTPAPAPIAPRVTAAPQVADPPPAEVEDVVKIENTTSSSTFMSYGFGASVVLLAAL
ncbi:hypothetical protein CRE_29432 [Caenorhabditis remanei]|uniref:Uncharacterized protein n=1 Tax=Caenorhabditis remanei TaxID=31234 RepID=E3LUZ5_CAERE|nr:hypothetical protein CRE_29432 [Caenorhabditis remanei]